ncbi:glycine betaine ABC transporter substrate-binding protein [Paraburkholderia tropica]|uniref:glycine betaine ABC transporter substrate-binding protein n=1 Tax=Paraburkholderia tropica TaxID=92647 RepID=UPI003D2C4142
MSNKTIRLGHIDLSFHAASAAVVQRILESYGFDISTRAAPHEKMFEMYGANEVDMLVSAWLPASHGGYLAPHKGKTALLGKLYEPYCIWGVPAYIPKSVLSNVEDLKKPDVLARIDKRIQGINPGAGISRFSREIVARYTLDTLGYEFHTGSEEDCFGRFEAGIKREDWFVIPLWHPQFLHHRFKIRELEEPLGLLGGHDQATLIASNACVAGLPDKLVNVLKNLRLGNATVSELDCQICREGISPLEAADQWLNKYPNLKA